MSNDNSSVCPSSTTKRPERTRFFPRQLVTAADLTQDQLYLLEKLRRHNRLLHGWGIVCGCEVTKAVDQNNQTVPWVVTIAPGYVLGPYGDEIIIPQEVIADLHLESLEGLAVSPCGDQLDPWCSEVVVERPLGQPLYIVVRYDECQTQPVRVQPAGCGCDETACEYSRIRDSFAIKVLTSPPSSYVGPAPPCSGSDSSRPCPPCPPEPWVVLAAVTLSADGQVSAIDTTLRRYVPVPGRVCTLNYVSGDAQQATITAVLPQRLVVQVSSESQPVANEPVTFRIRGGAGAVSGDNQTFEPQYITSTDPQGQASALWRLGPAPGLNTLEAAIASGSRLAFHALAEKVAVLLPPVIRGIQPANASQVAFAALQEKGLAITFDREMNLDTLRKPEAWLHVWQVALSTVVTAAVNPQVKPLALRFGQVSTDPVQGFTVSYQLADLQAPDPAQKLSLRFLVQIRATQSNIVDLSSPPMLLDADFAGTQLTQDFLDKIMAITGPTQMPLDVWKLLADSGAKLPSGDGKAGGNFSSWFAVA